MPEVSDREEEDEEEEEEEENEGQNFFGGDLDLGCEADTLHGRCMGVARANLIRYMGEKGRGPEQRPGPGPGLAPSEKRPGPSTQLREEMNTVRQKRGLSRRETDRAPDTVDFGGDARMGKGDDVDMRERGNCKHYWTCIGRLFQWAVRNSIGDCIPVSLTK